MGSEMCIRDSQKTVSPTEGRFPSRTNKLEQAPNCNSTIVESLRLALMMLLVISVTTPFYVSRSMEAEQLKSDPKKLLDEEPPEDDDEEDDDEKVDDEAEDAERSLAKAWPNA